MGPSTGLNTDQTPTIIVADHQARGLGTGIYTDLSTALWSPRTLLDPGAELVLHHELEIQPAN